jgi:hypothetical protein
MTHDRRHPDAAESGDGLGAVLRAWRRRQDARVDADALAARVAQAIRVDGALTAPSVGPRPTRRWAERTAWFAAGIAAAVAVVVALRAPPRDEGEDWPPSVRFQPGQIAARAALVAGMEDTFGPGLAWVVEHDRRVDVGLADDALPDASATFAVRIVVLSRHDDEAMWTVVWQSDVLTRDEQVVDVATGTTGPGRLRLWTHALSDGAIAVDGELALADAPLRLRASYGGVQRAGAPQRVTGDRTDGIEWQVIQTVVPLDRKREEVG